MPVLFSAMSYGSISYQRPRRVWPAPQRSWASITIPARAAFTRISTATAPNTIVQVASGRFGVHEDYLDGRRGH